MNTRLMSIVIVASTAVASIAVHAQTPQTAPTPQPPDHPRPTVTQTKTRAMPANPVMTITGCLTERKQARANAADRGAMIDDYVLTGVKMSPSSGVSGIGVSTKFDVRGIVEAELKKHVNQQVELIGQIVRPETETPADDTPDFLATTLKVVSATCVAEG
jgi:hypothetical protein